MNKIEDKPKVIFLQYLFKLIQPPTSIILKEKFQPWFVEEWVGLIMECNSSMQGGHPYTHFTGGML